MTSSDAEPPIDDSLATSARMMTGPRGSGRQRRNNHQPSQQEPASRFAVPRRSTLIGVAMVVSALVLGGGGTSNPHNEMILEIVIAALLLTGFIAPDQTVRGSAVPALAWIVASPLMLLSVVQLIPLPPVIWRNLPGREVERAVLDLVGAGQTWMPWTIAPASTFASLLATLCPVAIMLYVARMDLRGRTATLFGVVLIGLVSVVLGALQLSHFASQTWSLYEHFVPGWLDGFQANRNAEADVLHIAILAVASAGMVRWVKLGRLNLLAVFGVIAILAIGVLMTGSRAGIGLLSISIGFAVAIQWPRLARKIRYAWAWACATVAALVIAVYGLTRLTSVQNVLDRFSSDSEGRWDFWIDTAYAIRKAWPAGTGIGTFHLAHEAAERLEMVSPQFAGRAHNDWIEWTLETGLAGWVALGVTLLVLAVAVRRAWRGLAPANNDTLQRGHILFAIGVLVIESIHATVDFPTRSMSLATMIGVAVAVLMPLPAPSERSKPGQ